MRGKFHCCGKVVHVVLFVVSVLTRQMLTVLRGELAENACMHCRYYSSDDNNHLNIIP